MAQIIPGKTSCIICQRPIEKVADAVALARSESTTTAFFHIGGRPDALISCRFDCRLGAENCSGRVEIRRGAWLAARGIDPEFLAGIKQ